MKILLIQPKMNKRPMDSDLKIKMAPSMALLTLANLTPAEHEVIILNENIEKINFNCEVDLVGITITLDVMPRACFIYTEFSRRKIPVVAGGIHISCCPEDCIDHFDAICIGPAERVWSKILFDVQNETLKKVYCDNNDFKGDEIVSPVYRFAENKKYLYTNIIHTSRGCPNRCSFCYNSCKNRIYVHRPIANVIEEIKKINTKHIFFIDDNFISDPKYTTELLEQLCDINITWSAAATTKIVDYPKLLELMAKSGCKTLFIGFESINTISLEIVNKDNRVELYEAVINSIHNYGIMVNASMVFGLDGDDKYTFEKTLKWLVKMKIETLTSHILTPYPGTELYKKMNSEGRIINYDLNKYNTANVVFRPKNMTQKELYRGYRRIYRKFYSFKNIILRFPKCKTQRKSYLIFNLFYRKFGKLTSLIARIIPLSILGKIAAKISYNADK